MALSEIDRKLLDRCLARDPKAWRDFVDRFMGLAVHVVNHTASSRSLQISPADRDDLCADVFLAIVADDFRVLRRFRGESSLATYLTVIARRVVVREILRRKSGARLHETPVEPHTLDTNPDKGDSHEQRLTNREHVDRLLAELDDKEAQVVRMYHLDGKSYREISAAIGVPENSIGPTLSRARTKLRTSDADSPAG